MGSDKRWIELSIPGAQTRVVLFTPDGQEDRIGTFFNGSFACDDVDYSYRQLSERGVVFDGPPEKQPWGSFAKFRDPDVRRGGAGDGHPGRQSTIFQWNREKRLRRGVEPIEITAHSS